MRLLAIVETIAKRNKFKDYFAYQCYTCNQAKHMILDFDEILIIVNPTTLGERVASELLQIIACPIIRVIYAIEFTEECITREMNLIEEERFKPVLDMTPEDMSTCSYYCVGRLRVPFLCHFPPSSASRIQVGHVESYSPFYIPNGESSLYLLYENGYISYPFVGKPCKVTNITVDCTIPHVKALYNKIRTSSFPRISLALTLIPENVKLILTETGTGNVLSKERMQILFNYFIRYQGQTV